MNNTPGEPASSDALPPELLPGEASESAEAPANSPQEAENVDLSTRSGGEGTQPSSPLSVGEAGGSEESKNGEEDESLESSEPAVSTIEVVRNVVATDEPEINFDVDFIEERIEFSQEETRAILAKSLIFLFAGTIGASFIYIFVSSFIPRPVSCLPARIQMSTSATEDFPAPEPSLAPEEAAPNSSSPDSNVTLCSFDNSAKDLITLILNSITAIIGTALGFYFGTQTRGDRANNKTIPGDRQSTE